MSERYTKLFSLEPNLYNAEVPVMISAGALSKDNQAGKVFVQLRLQNVDTKYRSIVALKIAINTYDPAGNGLESQKEYQYLDLSAERGAEFGEKQAIYLDSPSARKFDITILEVVFAEGNPWIGEKPIWSSLGKQKTLEESLGSDLAGQYRRDTFPDAKYELTANNGLWLCTCGAVNPTGESTCCHCHNDKVALFKALDHTSLTEHFRVWNEETSQRKEAEKKKSTQKIAAIVAVICMLFVGVFFAMGNSINASKLQGTWQEAGYSYDGNYYVDMFDFYDNGGCSNYWYKNGKIAGQRIASYTIKENKVRVDFGGTSMTFEYRNGKLIDEGACDAVGHPDLIYSKIK